MVLPSKHPTGSAQGEQRGNLFDWLERLLQKQSKMLPLHMTVIHKAEHGRSTGGGGVRSFLRRSWKQLWRSAFRSKQFGSAQVYRKRTRWIWGVLKLLGDRWSCCFVGVVCGDPCQSVFVHLFRTVDRVEEKDLVFQEMVTKLHLVQRGCRSFHHLYHISLVAFQAFVLCSLSC